MRRSFGTLAMLGASLAACGESESGTIDVLAASSFIDVAAELERLIETELDVNVRFSFGSSGSFFEQMTQGAPASVVLTANALTMQRIQDAGLVDGSVGIASNRLALLTADTAAGRSITTLADLGSNTDAVVVFCASSAPCGAATDEMLEIAAVRATPASREPNVRATLTKVLLGEADAAIVYHTDAVAHPELRLVPIDDAVNVSVIARVGGVGGNDEAAEIVGLLAGADAQAVLQQAGFESP